MLEVESLVWKEESGKVRKTADQESKRYKLCSAVFPFPARLLPLDSPLITEQKPMERWWVQMAKSVPWTINSRNQESTRRLNGSLIQVPDTPVSLVFPLLRSFHMDSGKGTRGQLAQPQMEDGFLTAQPHQPEVMDQGTGWWLVRES